MRYFSIKSTETIGYPPFANGYQKLQVNENFCFVVLYFNIEMASFYMANLTKIIFLLIKNRCFYVFITFYLFVFAAVSLEVRSQKRPLSYPIANFKLLITLKFNLHTGYL